MQVGRGGKTVHLGRFATAEAAALCVLRAHARGPEVRRRRRERREASVADQASVAHSGGDGGGASDNSSGYKGVSRGGGAALC